MLLFIQSACDSRQLLLLKHALGRSQLWHRKSLTWRRNSVAREANAAHACARQPRRKRDSSGTSAFGQTSEKGDNLSSLPHRSRTITVETVFLLTIVPALWGSYGVATKIFLAQLPWVPLPFFNLASYIVAAASLRIFAFVKSLLTKSTKRPLPMACNKYASDRGLYIVAAELGLYLFLGSWIQLIGLAHTTATRSAFFVELTTVLVPVSDILILNAKVRSRTLLSALLAFAGVLVLGYEAPIVPGRALSPNTFALNLGDWLSILAAVLYTAHVVRLERVRAPSVLRLVDLKTLVQLVLGAAAVVLTTTRSEIAMIVKNARMASTVSLTLGLGCVTWIGILATAVASAAQVEGQRRVGPSLSAVVYSSQPLFAAVLALLVLGDQITFKEVLGGIMIVVAGFAVTSDLKNMT